MEALKVQAEDPLPAKCRPSAVIGQLCPISIMLHLGTDPHVFSFAVRHPWGLGGKEKPYWTDSLCLFSLISLSVWLLKYVSEFTPCQVFVRCEALA